MIKRVLLALAALLVLVLVVGFLLPDSAHLEQSASIAAPPCTVFAQLDDPKRVNRWSPRANLDRGGTVYTFSGPPRGAGARMTWSSEHRQVGNGSLEIVEAKAFEEVRMHLVGEDQGEADTVFRLAPAPGNDAVEVTWELDLALESGPLERYRGLFVGARVSRAFAEGLGRLKELAESLPQENWCDEDIVILEVPAKMIASTRGQSGNTSAEIGAALGEAFGLVTAFMEERGLAASGPPLAVNEEYGDDGYHFEAGLPLAEAPGVEAATGSLVTVREMPATRAVRLIHQGPYTNMTESYRALIAFLAARGLEAAGPSWEEYVSDPAQTPESELLTHIYVPIQG